MKKSIFSFAIGTGISLLIASCSKDITSVDAAGNAMVNYDAAFVVNSQSSSLSVINMGTNKVEKTIDLGNFQSYLGSNMMNMSSTAMWPQHIYLSPDKSKLVIATTGNDFSSGHAMMGSMITAGGSQLSGKIMIIDAVKGTLLKEIQMEGMTQNAAFSPDGKELWTSLMMLNGKVKVFDTSTFSLMYTIPVGQIPAELTFSEDGKKVYVANGMSNTVTIIDAMTKQILSTVTTGTEPNGAWPGMNGMMYVNNEGSQNISMIDVMTNLVTGTLPVGFMPGMTASNSIMNQIWVSDPDGGKVTMWTKTGSGYMMGGTVTVGSGATAIAFNKTGTTCYVTNQNDGTVSVVDVATLKEMMKIAVGKKPNGLVIRYQ